MEVWTTSQLLLLIARIEEIWEATN
jgi:hypothetical protein